MKCNVLAIALSLGLVVAGPVSAQMVQTELMLLCDISGSIDAAEFNLQRQGYANAFNSAPIQNLITQANGGVAVSLVYWSGAAQQSLAVGWTHLYDAASSSAFATAILGTGRPYSGVTAPGSAIRFGDPLFWNNTFTSRYQIMDVSGDGIQNDGLDTATQRNLALANGIDRINGLAIQSQAVFNWYAANVTGGTDSNTWFASSFADFGTAMQTKIATELQKPVVPEPSTLAMLSVGALGMIGMTIRRRFM